mgnify:CR=1 FL=1
MAFNGGNMNYRSYFCMLLLAVASYGSICAMQAFNQLPTSDSDASSSSAGQQQQLPIYEVLAMLGGQGTIEGVNKGILFLVNNNPENAAMLKNEVRRIQRDMGEPEFEAEIKADVRGILAQNEEYVSADPEIQEDMVDEQVDFKLAQFKAFAFAQLFSEVQVGSPPVSPRKKTYKQPLAGTPQASPHKKNRKRKVNFAEETDVTIIPNIKRARIEEQTSSDSGSNT